MIGAKSGLPVAAALFTLALAAAFLPAGAHEFTGGGITVAHPWARATPPAVKVGVAFMEIKAAPGKADKLLGARTPVAARAELHNHMMEKGIAKMRKVDGIAIPAGKSVVLGPHGYHVMLMDLSAPLKEGDLLRLTLIFEKSGEITVEAGVEGVGAMGPHGFDHQPGHEPAKKQPAGKQPSQHKH